MMAIRTSAGTHDLILGVMVASIDVRYRSSWMLESPPYTVCPLFGHLQPKAQTHFIPRPSLWGRDGPPPTRVACR